MLVYSQAQGSWTKVYSKSANFQAFLTTNFTIFLNFFIKRFSESQYDIDIELNLVYKPSKIHSRQAKAQS